MEKNDSGAERANSSFNLRSTSRGSLFVETEAARRMMDRFRRVTQAVAEERAAEQATAQVPAGQ